ncbi:hypothetical protein BJ165DRAFT_1530975 [Panaeolus papilionaceus]|nr:hypothetical protein BJ165DRAFT_1530975 [Panaeolus papilionaceus]
MSQLSTSPLRKKTPIKPLTGKPKRRKPCHDAKHFSIEERELIHDLKGAYRSMPGKNYLGWQQYIENHVNPRLQAYWREKGLIDHIVEPDGIVEKWDELIKNYVRKNWCSVIATAPLKALSLRITRSNYIYNTQRKAVITEIRGMLEEDEDLTTGLISKHRHQAVRNILQNMNDEELQDLEDKIEEAKIVGYTPEVKEQIYMKRCNQHMQQAAHLQYVEMGTLSIQVSVFMDQEGQSHIQFHDYARELLGMNTKSFEDTFPNELNDLANVFEKYVQKLLSIKSRISVTPKNQSQQDTAEGCSNAAAATSNFAASASMAESETEHLARYRLVASQLQDGAMDGTVKITEEGFPILPSPWPSNLNKWLQNKYYAKFMKAHYISIPHRGGRGDQTPVPWKALNDHPYKFFHEAYVTPSVIGKLKDAQNTSQGTINTFFEHVTARQDYFGPQHSFRFLHTHSKAHKGDDNPSGAFPSQYPGLPINSPNLLSSQEVVNLTPHTMKKPQDTPPLSLNSAAGNTTNDLRVMTAAGSHLPTTTETSATEVIPIQKEGDDPEKEPFTPARMLGTKSHLITPIESAKRPRKVKGKELTAAADASPPVTNKEVLAIRRSEKTADTTSIESLRGRRTHRTPSKVPVILSNIPSTP